ncbi:pseudouridine synthase [Butyricicoccus sp.]|uniref:pseudouridine synthase n=1 Tax=Butyricicoccus sp. TaxID=2049021 RepID=UPI003F144CD3
MQERLQKILSGAGVCSRRAAEKLMESGAVTVNGVTAKPGDRADAQADDIRVNGKRIGGHEELHTIMLYKPAGVVTTMSDEKNRKTVAQLVQRCPVRVLPVGRLDQYSEGLLLLTNDGALLDALTHPRYHVDKTYEVTVRGQEQNLPKLSEPMDIDGYRIRPAQVRVKARQPYGTFVLHMTIHEGRNRQIRKMCAQCGFKVLRLCRISIGALRLDRSLRPGQWRELSEAELALLCRDTLQK